MILALLLLIPVYKCEGFNSGTLKLVPAVCVVKDVQPDDKYKPIQKMDCGCGPKAKCKRK